MKKKNTIYVFWLTDLNLCFSFFEINIFIKNNNCSVNRDDFKNTRSRDDHVTRPWSHTASRIIRVLARYNYPGAILAKNRKSSISRLLQIFTGTSACAYLINEPITLSLPRVGTNYWLMALSSNNSLFSKTKDLGSIQKVSSRLHGSRSFRSLAQFREWT